jgi:hypothetical protein
LIASHGQPRFARGCLPPLGCSTPFTEERWRTESWLSMFQDFYRCLVSVSKAGCFLWSMAALSLLAGAVQADFATVSLVNGDAWDRPTLLGGPATFYAWENFNSPAGPNSPETVSGVGTGSTSTVTMTSLNGFGGPAGSTWNTIPGNGPATADAFNTGIDSFLTGGNIYSPTAIVTPRILIPNNIDGISGNQLTGFTVLTVQARTRGNLPDPLSFRLTDPISNSLISPFNFEVLATQVLGGFGGTLQDVRADFYVAGNADLYQIDFSAGSSSMSLDRLSVDTFFSPTAVPEPSSLLLLATSTFALVRRRRRRRDI